MKIITLEYLKDQLQTVHGYNGSLEDTRGVTYIHESILIDHDSEEYGDMVLISDMSLHSVLAYYLEGGYTIQGIVNLLHNGFIAFNYQNGMYQAIQLSY